LDNTEVEIRQHTREDIQQLFSNPCYQRMRLELLQTKDELYAKATSGHSDKDEVKMHMDKIAMIDEVLVKEQEYIKEFNEGVQ
jgi:hypothetical protein